MVAGQRWLQYGASPGPTGEVRHHLRAVPDDRLERSQAEAEVAALEDDVWLVGLRVRRLSSGVASLP